jgi:hypothetical protein
VATVPSQASSPETRRFTPRAQAKSPRAEDHDLVARAAPPHVAGPEVLQAQQGLQRLRGCDGAEGTGADGERDGAWARGAFVGGGGECVLTLLALSPRCASTRAGPARRGQRAAARAHLGLVERHSRGFTAAGRELSTNPGQNKASPSALKTDRHALGRPLSTDAEPTKPLCMQQRTCTRVQPVDGCVPGASTPLPPLSGEARNAWYNMRRSSCYSMRATARRWRGSTRWASLLACCSVVLHVFVLGPKQRPVRGLSGGGTAPVLKAKGVLIGLVVCPCWHAQRGGRDFTRIVSRGEDRSWCSRPRRRARQAQRPCRPRREYERALLYGSIRQRRLRWLPVRNQPQHKASVRIGQEAEEPPIRGPWVAISRASGE